MGTQVNQASKSSPSGRFARSLKVLLLCVAWALPGFFAARNLATWPVRLRYPGELDGVEGRELAEMVYLREGEPIYALPSGGSFHATNYGPLYYLLGAALVNPQRPTYVPMRLVSTLATVALAGACGLLAWWMTTEWAAGAMGFLLFLAFKFVTTYGTCARSDTMALLFWFSGFLIAYRFRYSSRFLWAAPLMAVGTHRGKFQFCPTRPSGAYRS
jgi:hypothetical protein